MSSIVEQILTGYGVPEALVKDAMEGKEGLKPDDIKTALSSHFKNTLLDDEEFITTIPEAKLKPVIDKHVTTTKTESFGIASKAVTEALGLKKEDIDSIPEEAKKNINQYTKACIAKFRERTGASQNQAEQILLEKAEIEGKLNTLLESQPAIEQKFKDEYDVKFSNASKNLYALVALSKLQENLPADAEILFPGIMPIIEAEADVRLINGKLEVFQKGKEFKIENKEGGGFHTFDSYLKSVLVARKSWVGEKDTTQGGQRRTVVIPGESQSRSQTEFDELHRQKLEDEKKK